MVCNKTSVILAISTLLRSCKKPFTVVLSLLQNSIIDNQSKDLIQKTDDSTTDPSPLTDEMIVEIFKTSSQIACPTAQKISILKTGVMFHKAIALWFVIPSPGFGDCSIDLASL
jgi:hypothetical protein